MAVRNCDGQNRNTPIELGALVWLADFAQFQDSEHHNGRRHDDHVQPEREIQVSRDDGPP